MKIRFVIEVDADFDLAGEGVNETELNIPAIKDAIENSFISEDAASFLVEELTDATGFAVTGLSVGMETPIVLAEGKIL